MYCLFLRSNCWIFTCQDHGSSHDQETNKRRWSSTWDDPENPTDRTRVDDTYVFKFRQMHFILTSNLRYEKKWYIKPTSRFNPKKSTRSQTYRAFILSNICYSSAVPCPSVKTSRASLPTNQRRLGRHDWLLERNVFQIIRRWVWVNWPSRKRKATTGMSEMYVRHLIIWA